MNNGYKLTLTCDLKANEDIFLVDHFWITDYLHSRQQLHQLQIQNENVVKRIIQILDIQPNQDSNLFIYLLTYLLIYLFTYLFWILMFLCVFSLYLKDKSFG